MKKPITLAMLALFTWAATPAVAADNFLGSLAGNWQGKGFVRASVDAPEENIRCRLATSLSGTNRLSVNGTCQIAGFMLPVVGNISNDDGVVYSSTIFRALPGYNITGFSGRLRGSNLALQYTGTDLKTRKAIKAFLTISYRGKKFDISMRSTDPDTKKVFDVGTIRFAQR